MPRALLFARNENVILDMHDELSVAIMYKLSIAPESQMPTVEYFLKQFEKDRAVPTFKKVFCIKSSNWNVEEEVWFRDLDADPKYPLHKYFVLHVHFHQHRDKPADIDTLSDLTLVDAANVRNLIKVEKSKRSQGKIIKLIAQCPYADTLINDNSVHIFPPAGEMGRCTNLKCNNSIPYNTALRCPNRFPCPGLSQELKENKKQPPFKWQCHTCTGWNDKTEGKCRYTVQCQGMGPGRQWEWQKDKDVDKNLYMLLEKSDRYAEWWDGIQRTRGRPAVNSFHEIDTESLEKKTKRIQALCIGIEEYEKDQEGNDWRLPNAGNDAQLLRDKLIELGANVTLIRGDAIQKKVSRQDMFVAVQEFAQTLAGSRGVDFVFLYIGCHGYQIDGKVYLLPSDFPFQKMSSETAYDLVCELGLHLQNLIARIDNAVKKITPIDNAVKESNLKPSPHTVCLYLVDCCRIAPEGVKWQGIDELRFDENRGTVIFSCKGGQKAIDGRQRTGGPFALEMANQLFATSKSVGQAVTAVSDNLLENYNHDIDVRGFKVLTKQSVCLAKSNRFAFSAPHIQNIADFEFEEESSAECISEDESTEQESEISDRPADFQNEGFCGAYFDCDISQLKQKIAELLATIYSMNENSFSFAELLICNIMHDALENGDSKRRERWKELCRHRDVANDAKQVEEMICFFNETIARFEAHGLLRPRIIDAVVSNFHKSKSSSTSAFKFILFDFLKCLVGPRTDQMQQNQMDLLANAAHDVECSDIDFLKLLDKFIIDDFEEECQTISRDCVAIQRKSFVCLFKLSRLLMTIIIEIVRIDPEKSLEISKAGVIYLFSSFKEYSFIPVRKSVSISPASRKKLFESMSHLARLSSFELHTLAMYENARQRTSGASSLEEFISNNIDDNVTSTAMEEGHQWNQIGDRCDKADLSKMRLGHDHDHAVEESKVSF